MSRWKITSVTRSWAELWFVSIVANLWKPGNIWPWLKSHKLPNKCVKFWPNVLLTFWFTCVRVCKEGGGEREWTCARACLYVKVKDVWEHFYFHGFTLWILAEILKEDTRLCTSRNLWPALHQLGSEDENWDVSWLHFTLNAVFS